MDEIEVMLHLRLLCLNHFVLAVKMLSYLLRKLSRLSRRAAGLWVEEGLPCLRINILGV